jgi:hypothetical protein
MKRVGVSKWAVPCPFHDLKEPLALRPEGPEVKPTLAGPFAKATVLKLLLSLIFCYVCSFILFNILVHIYKIRSNDSILFSDKMNYIFLK